MRLRRFSPKLCANVRTAEAGRDVAGELLVDDHGGVHFRTNTQIEAMRGMGQWPGSRVGYGVLEEEDRGPGTPTL